MNHHTEGPLKMATFPIIESSGFTFNVATINTSGFCAPDSEQRANAKLLRASYNAFDKAGRALGVDAAELAEQIDLATLIRAARELHDAASRPNFGYHGRGAYELDVLRDALAKLPE